MDIGRGYERDGEKKREREVINGVIRRSEIRGVRKKTLTS